jgi:hypothetical protein
LGIIPALKINDFKLIAQKNYTILAPHRYLMKMTGKNPNIFHQSWIKELVCSMIFNVMNIPHFN